MISGRVSIINMKHRRSNMSIGAKHCSFCKQDGIKEKAVNLAPQSLDCGETITWEPVCASHAWGWWDGADWGPIAFKAA
jgi:hypothetical protein